jgi:ELWxxDGT repeat protein
VAPHGRMLLLSAMAATLLSLAAASGAVAAPGDVTVSQVADIRPGLMPSNPQSLIDAGGILLFSATDGTNGTELWKSTGGPLGPGGTEMVENIESGSGDSTPQELTRIGDTVFFNAFDSTHGRELWKIDPPYTDAVRVEDINSSGSSSSSPSDLTAVGTTLLFQANDGPDGEELWKSVPPYDAASTDLVKDINTSGNSSPNGLFNASGTLLFDADDGGGSALWKSESPYDAAHTTKLPGGVSFPAPYANASGAVLFGAEVSGDFELWKMAGPPFTTPVLVKNINATGDSDVNDLTNVNGTVFFTATDGGATVGLELWKSVPPYNAANTTPLDINSGTSDSNPSQLGKVGGQLFLSAGDGTHGLEPWRSNGGPVNAGTDLVANIATPGSSNPAHFTDVNGTAFFPAFESAGPNLFRSTGVGATKVSTQFTTGSAPQQLTNVAGTLFFTATDSATTTGQELWKATIEPAPAPTVTPPASAPTVTAPKKKCKKKHKKHAASAKKKKCKRKK